MKRWGRSLLPPPLRLHKKNVPTPDFTEAPPRTHSPCYLIPRAYILPNRQASFTCKVSVEVIHLLDRIEILTELIGHSKSPCIAAFGSSPCDEILCKKNTFSSMKDFRWANPTVIPFKKKNHWFVYQHTLSFKRQAQLSATLFDRQSWGKL